MGRLFGLASAAGLFATAGGSILYRYEYGNMAKAKPTACRAVADGTPDSHIYDVAVVGGGIVGVATAREIHARFPRKRILLLEKEADVAQHQSGHNSGCLHAGFSYPVGTSMARLCPRGHALMVAYCKANNLPLDMCGKLVVGHTEADVKQIEKMHATGVTNGVRDLQVLRGREAIQAKAPLVEGSVALWSPHSGITDFAEVTRHMLATLKTNSPQQFAAQFQFEVQDFVGVETPAVKNSSRATEPVVLIRGRESGQSGPEKPIMARTVITCCGLGNDAVAKHTGSVLSRIGDTIRQTYAFRGRYHQLKPEKRDMIKMHVYPCPQVEDDSGMSLGVHFTPTVDVRRGRQVIIGPGCALAMDRYGYTPYTIDLEYCFHAAFSKAGWVSLMSNMNSVWRMYQIDLSRRAFLNDARRLVPSLEMDDIEDSFSGVMAYGVDQTGRVNFDLAMELAVPRLHVPMASSSSSLPQRPLILNVRNAPSPAATASMAIAEDIVEAASTAFQWG